jgi:Sugar-binding N-terminal domain
LKAPGKTIDERHPCSCGLVYRHGSNQLRRPVDQGRLIMLLGVIADDFTGASDLANTLVKGGMRTTHVDLHSNLRLGRFGKNWH